MFQHAPAGNTGGALPVTELSLVLPLPPSINHQYATVQGRRVLSRDGRAYKRLVADEIERWLDAQPAPEAAVAVFRRHCLALHITFFFATLLRRDLDGGLKIAQDALCEALGVNDNLVVEIHLHKRVDRRQPRIDIRLTALTTDMASLAVPQGHGDVPAMGLTPRRKHRRHRRRGHSLEELARRYNWD